MIKKFLILKNAQAGMSLVEILVVVMIMGILAAISAPNFFNFFSQQKLTKLNENVELLMRQVQNQSQREKVNYTLEFQVATNKDFQYKIYQGVPSATNTTTWKSLSDQPENLTVSLTQGKNITFNSNGTINSSGELQVNEKIVVSLANLNPPSKRCVIVQSLLGSLSNGKNTECN
ncbi:prepilin-type N-terminal cleavage/methylation domain-containing protein [Gloeothece verrucosa]|uniref:PilA n=1 Tax=Gloeothece verrucosa (strain PCC 7822) TaxID=497965 RepID=E0U925_GLOV7|nr:prepilin-type N-terminal cleavage/methylation domain-containing protein [Gloeothece verrucosa]ADN16164.1 PilA [Gloeothece verrucosa PCC 7822]